MRATWLTHLAFASNPRDSEVDYLTRVTWRLFMCWTWLTHSTYVSPFDVLHCRLFFAKEPVIIGLFCGRIPIWCPTWLTNSTYVSHLKIPAVSDYTCVMSSYVWHDSSMWATWLIHVCNVTNSICFRIPTKKLGSRARHTWMSHVARMDQLCHSHTWVMAQVIHMCDIHESWRHTCDKTDVCEWHDSSMRATWLSHSAPLPHTTDSSSFTLYVWHEFVRIPPRNSTYMTHSCARRDSHTCHTPETRVVSRYTCDMAHECVWHDSLLRLAYST